MLLSICEFRENRRERHAFFYGRKWNYIYAHAQNVKSVFVKSVYRGTE
jgi:hypothetical protein